MKRLLLLIGFVSQTVGVLSAQTYPSADISRASNAAYFNYTRVGDVAVTVNIWGTIRYPGRYELTKGSDLGDAVSLAGGPADIGDRPKEYARSISVTLSRQGINGRQVIFQSDLSQIVESKTSLPVLQDDDVLYVNTVTTSKTDITRILLPAMNLVATTLLIVWRIIDIRRTN
jgi:hypothetical protein